MLWVFFIVFLPIVVGLVAVLVWVVSVIILDKRVLAESPENQVGVFNKETANELCSLGLAVELLGEREFPFGKNWVDFKVILAEDFFLHKNAVLDERNSVWNPHLALYCCLAFWLVKVFGRECGYLVAVILKENKNNKRFYIVNECVEFFNFLREIYLALFLRILREIHFPKW